MSLKELQQNFQNYLLTGDEQVLPQLRAPDNKQSAEDRIGIYRNGYFERLIERLSGDFSALDKLLGHKDFRVLVVSYLMTSPPKDYSIHCLGDGLLVFLQSHYPKEVVWQELATFELALAHSALLPAGQNFLPILAQLSQEQLFDQVFAWQPSVRQLAFASAVPELWQSLTTETELAPEEAMEGCAYLVWNSGLEPCFMRLAGPSVLLAAAIDQGQSFLELCETMAQVVPEDELVALVSGTIRSWLEAGLLTAA